MRKMMDFLLALDQFGKLKTDTEQCRYRSGLQDPIVDGLVQRLDALITHFYTSNLIINSFGSDIIPLKYNAARASTATRIDSILRLIDSILNDIKLKQSETQAVSKGIAKTETLMSEYRELMDERNDIVKKHNDLIDELGELHPKLDEIKDQRDQLEKSLKKYKNRLATVTVLLLTTLNLSAFVILSNISIWVCTSIQALVFVIYFILKTGKLPIIKRQPLKEFGMKFLNDLLVKLTVGLALLGLGYLIYLIFGVKIKF